LITNKKGRRKKPEASYAQNEKPLSYQLLKRKPTAYGYCTTPCW